MAQTVGVNLSYVNNATWLNESTTTYKSQKGHSIGISALIFKAKDFRIGVDANYVAYTLRVTTQFKNYDPTYTKYTMVYTTSDNKFQFVQIAPFFTYMPMKKDFGIVATAGAGVDIPLNSYSNAYPHIDLSAGARYKGIILKAGVQMAVTKAVDTYPNSLLLTAGISVYPTMFLK